MAQLTFNTDEGRATANLIGTTASNLQSELTNLRSNVANLIGSAWIGNSANLFQGEFDAWANEVTRIINELEQLQQRLNTEIIEWEQTAANFQ